MAKAVADVNGEDQGGFASDNSNITGFSHMHDSGTGGVRSQLANFYSKFTISDVWKVTKLGKLPFVSSSRMS